VKGKYIKMQINTSNLVSMTEANQNFSRVAKMVDSNGAVVILKNNAPRYVLMDYTKLEEESKLNAECETIQAIGERIVKKHLFAFMELAK
jgi:antitoxin Phd